MRQLDLYPASAEDPEAIRGGGRVVMKAGVVVLCATFVVMVVVYRGGFGL